MSKYYAGIGSRKTPIEILDLMNQIATELSNEDWTLRSGGADGADSAFEVGATKKQIFLPWNGFNIREVEGDLVLDNLQAWDLVSKHFHPAPEKCTQGAQRLHGRNAFIILGPELNEPVDMVICWTPKGEVTGGTGLALRIAEHFEIPVFNLANANALDQLVEFVNNQ